jgi:hypothetical protein
LKPMKKSVKRLIETLIALELLEKYYQFLYVAEEDDRTCPECSMHDKKLITLDGAIAFFPFLFGSEGDAIWFPRVHNHCRCVLISGEFTDLQVASYRRT